MGAAKVSVTSVGASPVDQKLLKSLFILSDQNEYQYEFVDGDADILVVDLDGISGAQLDSYRAAAANRPTLFVARPDREVQEGLLYIPKPFRVKPMFSALNELAKRATAAMRAPSTSGQARPAQKAAAQPVSATAETHFDPDRYLIGLLKKAVRGKETAVIQADFYGKIAIRGGDRLSFTDISVDDMAKVCTLTADKFKYNNADVDEIEALYGKECQWAGCDDLLWRAAYYASGGRLMKGSQRDDVVALKHWPNLTRVPAPDIAVRWCALVSRYPTSVALAARMLKAEPSEVHAIYSAARASGAAAPINKGAATEQDIEQKQVRNRGLLGKLLSKVSGL